MTGELQKRKIFPLNQTAHSDFLVRGNPVTTRPDDAVENTFPGLEFDHRNIEKQFFPGLVFELHHRDAAWLRSFDPASGYPITEADREAGLTLWHVRGNFPAMDGSGRVEISAFSLFGMGGTGIWQILRELEAGNVAVVLGPPRAAGQTIPAQIDDQVQQALQAGNNTAISFGASRLVVLFGRRSEYLVEGVINPSVFEAGDLTRSLCAPWQYDFTDCGCWYWASNKPDMVAVSEDGPQLYNFQRVRTGANGVPEPPQHPPVVSIDDWTDGRTSDATGNALPGPERVPRQMNHADLINGWETLPIVLNDVEASKYVAKPVGPVPDDQLLPDVGSILARLSYLASIEHALMVEYLYAYYSVAAPRRQPDLTNEPALRLYEAANTILGVAIDEMRHFRWVNEILVMLGHAPVVVRADKTIDLDGDGRFLDHTFALIPASEEQIDWFIAVERPSKEVDPGIRPDTIDGMYTRLLFSIERSPDISQGVKDRVLHLIKLIIDEGYDHYHRFQRVKQLLPSGPANAHLQLPPNPTPLAPTHVAKEFETRVNRSYEVILNLLLIVFGRGDAEHGNLIEATRIAMVDSMDVEIQALINAGGAPLFSVPQVLAERNLGRFALARQKTFADKLVVLEFSLSDSAKPSLTQIVEAATGPLDALNTAHAGVADKGLQALAAQSASAMQRVRARFLSIMNPESDVQ